MNQQDKTFKHSEPWPEVGPQGINVAVFDEKYAALRTCVLEYLNAIQFADNGSYDNEPSKGMRIIADVWHACEQGYFFMTPEQQAVTWRWIVACLFVNEQADINGKIAVKGADGKEEEAVLYVGENGGMTIYPAAVRLSLSRHIDELALEKYGAEEGYRMAASMYMTMTNISESGVLELSDEGREMLCGLHNFYIDKLNAEGVPEAPVIH